MSINRVYFREEQVLRKADLIDEQAYRIAQRRRHNIAHHTWGIVVGLEIDADIKLQPGMAVDGYGRELIVTDSMHLKEYVEGYTFQKPYNALTVWLQYNRRDFTSSDMSYQCMSGQDNRSREAPNLRLTPIIYDPGSPYTPLAMPNFGPHDWLPDDPSKEWPVYLGVLYKDGTGDWQLDGSNRRYVTLIGNQITSPSDLVRMQLASDDSSDQRRFAVSFANAKGIFEDRLVINRKGEIHLHGSVRQRDKLTLQAPHTSLVFGTPKELPEEPPAEAIPWRIYRFADEEKKPTVNELRIEMFHPGDKGDPALNQISLGYTQKEEDGTAKSFTAGLTVRADGSSSISGNLKVTGQVTVGPIPDDPTDPRFQKAMIQQWIDVLLASASTIISGLQVEISAQGTAPANSDFEVTAWVMNPSEQQVRNIQVHLVGKTKSGERVVIESRQLGLIDSLPPKGRLNVTKKVKLPSRGPIITLTVTAVSMTVRPLPIIGVNSKDVTVIRNQPIPA
ncbi:MAG TPA: hypothetical protein VGB67_16860 [Fibrella sp.]|jgi:hypothetical protein